jgi:hypothetical protein
LRTTDVVIASGRNDSKTRGIGHDQVAGRPSGIAIEIDPRGPVRVNPDDFTSDCRDLLSLRGLAEVWIWSGSRRIAGNAYWHYRSISGLFHRVVVCRVWDDDDGTRNRGVRVHALKLIRHVSLSLEMKKATNPFLSWWLDVLTAEIAVFVSNRSD